MNSNPFSNVNQCNNNTRCNNDQHDGLDAAANPAAEGELSGKKIVLALSGGIAAYKSAELCRLLIKAGASVKVVMSAAATRFVTPLTFQALSGQPVAVDMWEDGSADGMAHIALSRDADLLLIAPASADCLARLAQGRASDLLSALALARDCPLLVAPAMNRCMWQNPATQRNVSLLKGDGVRFVGPAEGEQACGETGAGRFSEPAAIVEAVLEVFSPPLLAGQRVVITAGPTFEAIDSVRGITNLSSGRMGFAVARAAARAGAQVTLIAGPVSLPTPLGVERVNVVSALEMHDAVMKHLNGCSVFIAVAAVADYRVAQTVQHKLKKQHGTMDTLTLVENPDILARVAALAHPPFCVGFAAESENLIAYAKQKRARKNIPLLAANLVQEGFGGDNNRLILISDRGEETLPTASKAVLAVQLVAHIAAQLSPAPAA